MWTVNISIWWDFVTAGDKTSKSKTDPGHGLYYETDNSVSERYVTYWRQRGF